MLYTGAPVDPAEEHQLDLSFDCAYDGTNESIKIETDDGVVRGIA
jgi:hypothetical protein